MTLQSGATSLLSHPDDDSEDAAEEWKYHDGELWAGEPDFITDAAQIDTEIGRIPHDSCIHGVS